MTKRVLIPIATGFEEIEALTVVDILRRAGAEVVLAGVGNSPIVGRSDVSVNPDMPFAAAVDSGPFDMIVLPGGLPNAHILRDSEEVVKAVRAQQTDAGLIGAICAAPLALDRAGVLAAQAFTSHPGARDGLPQEGYSEDRVVVSDNVITSRGPGTAMEFAFAIVDALYGADKVNSVNAGVLAQI